MYTSRLPWVVCFAEEELFRHEDEEEQTISSQKISQTNGDLQHNDTEANMFFPGKYTARAVKLELISSELLIPNMDARHSWMVVRSDREHNERGSRLKARTSEPPSEIGQCPSTGLVHADKKEELFFNRGLTSSLS